MLTFIKTALRQRCPRCREGRIFKPGFTLQLVERCPACGLNLAANDNGDGPIVIVVFVLCFLLGPAAVITDVVFTPPLWLHMVLWPTVTLLITALLLRPSKTLILGLQYRNRPGDWMDKDWADKPDA